MATVTNYAINPSAEYVTLGANGWQRFTGTGTLTKSADFASDRTNAAKYVSANAGGFEGIGGKSVVGLGWTGSAEVISAAVDLRGDTTLDVCVMRVYYTDASTSDGTNRSIVLTGAFVRQEFVATLNPAKIVDRIDLICCRSTAAAYTMYQDRLFIAKSPTTPDYFDGAKYPDGSYVYAWSGEADNSASTRTDTSDPTGAASRILVPLHAGRRRPR